jgi:hypothetical protein
MRQTFDVPCGCGALAVLVLCACGGGGASSSASLHPGSPTADPAGPVSPSNPVPPGPLAGPKDPAQKEPSTREPTATGRPGAEATGQVGASLAPASSTSQSGREGAAVRELPAVIVLSASGEPVAGAAVRFDVVTGGGTLAGAEARSDANGRAQVGSWKLGAGAQQAVRATLPGVASAEVTFAATAASAVERYDVTLRYVTSLSERQRAAFEAARQRIEEVVVGDLADVALRLGVTESCAGVAIDETVDDLLIAVRVTPIDGPRGTLGRAGPCLVRGGGLPVLALMEFDSDDLDDLDARGQLEAVILHEMLHTVGFGTVWGTKLVNAGLEDPFFDGAQARSAFHDHDGGLSYSGVPVPVENEGKPGTRDSHWRESEFGDELMTGWLTGVRQPLSRTTIASLGDLGYSVDLSAADSTRTAAAFNALAAELPPVHLGEDVLPIPVRVVH